jgi:hypothetical protein
MRKMVLAILLSAVSALAASDNKPLAPDTHIKRLKVPRQLPQVQMQMVDLPQQFDQASNLIKQLQAHMDSECIAVAKELYIDLDQCTCDLDQLMFVPK